MRVENYRGHDIRFEQIDDTWMVSLHDICDVFGIDEEVFPKRNVIEKDGEPYVFEIDLYRVLLTENFDVARQFKFWGGTVMQKVRKLAGLEEFEMLKMTEPETQEMINDYLDNLFYNEDTGKLMLSVTVAGGDVEQVEVE